MFVSVNIACTSFNQFLAHAFGKLYYILCFSQPVVYIHTTHMLVLIDQILNWLI